MPDDEISPRSGLLERLMRAYHSLLSRTDRPDLPATPSPDDYVPDLSPATPEERARAEVAAREAMRRLRSER